MMSGSKLWSMAWKNLWRNRRRTLITLSSIAFGTMLAVLFTGLGDATYSDMIDMAARMGGGHVAVQHPTYLELPSLKKSITEVGQKKKLALQQKNVDRAVPRITGQIMLSTASNSVGAYFIGVDPKEENKDTLSILEAIKEGSMLQSSKSKGIVLGKKLAENLGLRLGKKVVYTTTDKNGEIVTGLARLSGVVSTGAPGVDRGLAILPIDVLRKTLGYGEDEATRLAVFINDQRKSAEVATALQASLGDDVVALPWNEVQPDLAGFISMKVAGAIFFEIIIMVLVAAGIFNTLFVSVMERIRELGIMMAIGFSPLKLFGLIMWESLWLGLVGLVSALLVTAWPYHYLNTKGLDMSAMMQEGVEVAGVGISPIMYVSIYPENLLTIALAVLLATVLSGVYPAWRAGRVVPVESIKLV
jgi:ABC-type lipoprotein release transport system permease subunit